MSGSRLARLSILGLANALLLTMGCGGGGSGAGGGNNNGIGGLIQTATYAIPAGQTVLVGSDLVINASKGIQIDGSLQVPPGVNVSLITAGAISGSGSIDPAPVTAQVKRVASHRGGGPNNIVLVTGTDALIPTRAPAGTGIAVAANGPGVDIQIYVIMRAGKGADAPDLKTPAQAGSNVEIGTAAAIGLAKAAGATTPQAPDNVTGGSIYGGAGGAGFADPGTDNGTSVTISSSKGAKGGDVNIVTNQAVDSPLYGGDGGEGGSADFTAPATVSGRDGESIIASPGNGGDGGSVSAAPALPSIHHGGIGGAAGDAGLISQTSTSGGNGGDITLNAGNYGADGAGGPTVTSTLHSLFSCTGGSGGTGTASHPDGYRGGNIRVLQNGKAVSYPKYYIALHGAAGGNAYDQPCGATPKPGGAGGAGGNIDTAGAKYSVNIYPNLPGDEKGGNGSSGTPAGAPGSSGLDLFTSKKISTDGNPGSLCTGGTYSVFRTAPAGGFVNACVVSKLSSSILALGNDTPQTSLQLVPTGGGAPTQLSLPGDASKTLSSMANTNPTSGSRALPQNMLYVALKGSGQVGIIDLAQGKSVGTITVPGAASGSPNALALDTATGQLYVDTGTSVVIFDTTNANAVLATIPTNMKATAMAVNSTTHRAYVSGIASDFAHSALFVIDGASQQLVTTLDRGGALAADLAVNPTTGAYYAVEPGYGRVVVFNGATNAVTTTLSSLSNPSGIAVDAVLNRFYVATTTVTGSKFPGTLLQFNGATNTQTGSVAVGQYPQGVAVDASSNLIYVANQQDSSISVVYGG